MVKRILIVDDEKTLAFLLRENLAASDPEYDVSLAHSGEQALNDIDSEPFDLVITDFRMPGMDGLELIRRLQPVSPSSHTILITAYGDEEIEAEGRRLGISHYISKPFRVETLLKAVREVLYGQPVPDTIEESP